MRISKLACFEPPPFAPHEVEPGVFILRQVFDREQILWRVAKTILIFMLVMTLLGWSSQMLSSISATASTRVLMLMLFLLPYPLLVVGWLIWTMVNFVRYFTERSRTREIRIELKANGTHNITINDRRFDGSLYASAMRIRRGVGLLSGSQRFLAIYLDAGRHVLILVCTQDVAEYEQWQEWLHIGGFSGGTTIPVRGVL